MKTLRTFLCLTLFTLFLAPSSKVQAAVAATDEQNQAFAQQMANEQHDQMAAFEAKFGHRFVKRIARMEKFLSKFSKKDSKAHKVDFQSEPDKWMWFWLFGWLAGALLYSFGWFIASPFWYLGYLCWLAGTICLIIWILKKTGNM